MNREYKEKLSRKIEKNYSDLEERIMQDIVRRIYKTGEITSTADYQINRLIILGNSTEDVEKMIKDALGASYPEMFELYDQVINWEYVRNKDIYEQINQQFIPYEENVELQQITEALIRQTESELENITRSLGFYLDYGNGRRVQTPLSQVYQGYLDAACMDIVTGAFDYNSVLRRVVTQLTNSGLRTIDYASGYSNRVEVAARRAVMTGISQLTGHISDMNAKLLGTDHFEVAWHAGARPSHAEWQGKVYTRDDLYRICGLGTVTGLLGANCYHEYYPFFPGISERNWTDKWLEDKKREENMPKIFNGKEYTLYEAKQQQRRMETAMRAQREKVELLKKGGANPDEIMLARCKYQAQLDEYARFSKKMGLKQERERIYMDMRGRVAPMPSFMKLSDTTDKWAKEARRELLKSERSIGSRKRETMEVYSPSGDYILTKRGNANSVSLSILDYYKLIDAVVTHNHPSGGSFSFTDLKFLKRMPISELRVATVDGAYYMRKPSKWPDKIKSSKAMEEAYNQIRKNLKAKYEKMYNENKITEVERHKMLTDEVNKVFAERYGLEYGFEFFR